MVNAEKIEGIFKEIVKERKRQFVKFGHENHSPAFWAVILGEEFGEVCKDIQSLNWKGYRKELIQVAAVAVKMIEVLDQRIDDGIYE
jgi:NTP pyrophosphatase (non-canonical NTP hydrolase)